MSSSPATTADAAATDREFREPPGPAPVVRAFGWSMLTLLVAFLANVVLTFWFEFPGITPVMGWGNGTEEAGIIAILQLIAYPAAVGVAIFYVLGSGDTPLRRDAARLSNFNAFLVRACFWAVFLVGLVDAALSWLRVEDMLGQYFGAEEADNIGRSDHRGLYYHMPAIVLGIVLACVTRTIGVIWLALLVVVAELLIVFSRFIFSYEQSFMADLVRFWYAALFLFASAYTLLHDGHVRVDVFYAGMSARAKGVVNSWGSILLGMTLCWTVIILGMWTPSSVIVSPILVFETTQSGFGMYVKYLMAGFIGVFAITMLIQFVSYFFESWADKRGEVGHRPEEHAEPL